MVEKCINAREAVSLTLDLVAYTPLRLQRVNCNRYTVKFKTYLAHVAYYLRVRFINALFFISTVPSQLYVHSGAREQLSLPNSCLLLILEI